MKYCSAEEAVRVVQSGQRVYVGSNLGAPQSLIRALTERSAELRAVKIIHLLTEGAVPYLDPKVNESFQHEAFFFGQNVREMGGQSAADYMPIFLSDVPRAFYGQTIPLDVAMVTTTYPDSEGFVSLGVSVDIGFSACKSAKTILAEFHPKMPFTLGKSRIHVSEIDFAVEANYPMLEHPISPNDAVSDRIAEHIIDLIPDGACLQMGIGAIPNAVMAKIHNKNDLGIHTEMISDGLLEPLLRGNINGSRKQINPHRAVASFCLGTHKIFEAIDKNDFFEFQPTEYVNDPFIISQNDQVVAINSALQIDLTGQVCSDSLGTSIYSGIGGQVDFIRGANRSKGGKPIIAIPSTAKGGSISRISTLLSPGAGVVTSRGDVHYVVTEHGIANLHAKTIPQRAELLISIAHPDFRDQLRAQAKELRLL